MSTARHAREHSEDTISDSQSGESQEGRSPITPEQTSEDLRSSRIGIVRQVQHDQLAETHVNVTEGPGQAGLAKLGVTGLQIGLMIRPRPEVQMAQPAGTEFGVETSAAEDHDSKSHLLMTPGLAGEDQ